MKKPYNSLSACVNQNALDQNQALDGQPDYQ